MQIKRSLPNSTAVLVLGITSIVTCSCYGIIGLVLGIVALVLAQSSTRLYRANPDMFYDYANLNAGRICAIIGICLSALHLLLIFFYLVILGLALPWSDIAGDIVRDFA